MPIMKRLTAIVLLGLLVACGRGPALAQAVHANIPRLEFAQGCRDGAQGNAATQERCVVDEQKARDKLATEWEQFAHADRTQCTELAKLGGGLQSYVELLTCLEMAKIAKGLPKD
jgi:hypothetical protein